MTAGQSLAEGAAGIALLHLETGRWTAACAALEEAVADGVSIAGNASLYYGAPALAFVLASSDHPGLARAKTAAAEGTATVTRRRLLAAHRRIDRRRRPQYAEYDLIRGLTGLGVALRRIGDLDLLREVLAYLVRLTDPIGHLPGWWCRTGPGHNQPAPEGGHGNHGIAHGITGPLALLALTYLDGVRVDGHTEAIERITGWLDAWQQHTDDGAHGGHRPSPSPTWNAGNPPRPALCARPGATEPPASPAPSSSPPVPSAIPPAGTPPNAPSSAA